MCVSRLMMPAVDRSGPCDCHPMSGLHVGFVHDLCFCVIAIVPNPPGFAAQVLYAKCIVILPSLWLIAGPALILQYTCCS